MFECIIRTYNTHKKNYMPANFVPTLIISSFFFNIFKKQTKSHLLGEDDRTKTKNSRKKNCVVSQCIFDEEM